MSEDLRCWTSSVIDFVVHSPYNLSTILLSLVSPLDPARYSNGTTFWGNFFGKCKFCFNYLGQVRAGSVQQGGTKSVNIRACWAPLSNPHLDALWTLAPCKGLTTCPNELHNWLIYSCLRSLCLSPSRATDSIISTDQHDIFSTDFMCQDFWMVLSDS